jgi:hypothetical protein
MVRIRDLLLPTDEPPIKTEEREERFAKPANPLSETTHFEVEFILDTVCPNCYVCLRNLDAAIAIHKEQHPDSTFEVTCSPFILDPAGYRSGEFSFSCSSTICQPAAGRRVCNASLPTK